VYESRLYLFVTANCLLFARRIRAKLILVPTC
jgi:hypothetical protein